MRQGRSHLVRWVTVLALVLSHLLAAAGGVALERGTITTYHTAAHLHHTVTITCHVLGDGDIMEELEWRKANGTKQREQEVLPSSQIRFLKAIWLYRRAAPEAGYGERDLTVDPRVSQTQDWYTCNLTITQVQPKDEGLYRCIAINLSADTTDIYLTVHSTLPVIGQTPEVVEVKEGGEVTLDCPAIGHPEPLVSWRRQGGWGEVTTSRPAVTGSRKLRLEDTRRGDAGNYTCIAISRTAHTAHTATRTFRVAVLYPAQVWPSQEVVWSPLGATVALECEVRGHPPPSLHWTLPNETTVLVDGTAPPGRFTLILHNLTTPSYGRYLCRASNSLGESEAVVRLYESVISHHQENGSKDAYHPGDQATTSPGDEDTESQGRDQEEAGSPIPSPDPPSDNKNNMDFASHVRYQPVHSFKDGEEPRPVVVVGAREVRVTEGDVATLECDVHHPAHYKLAWLRRGSPTQELVLHNTVVTRDPRFHAHYHLVNGVARHHLTILDAQPGDAGTYVCQVTSKLRASQKVYLRVVVEEPRDDVVTMGGVKIVRREGEAVTLHCPVTESDTGASTVSWSKLDKAAINSTQYNPTRQGGVVRVTGQELHFRTVSRRDAATYVCTATLARGLNITHHLQLIVHYGAEVEASETVVGGVLGARVVLKCLVRGSPSPTLFWTHSNGSVIYRSSEERPWVRWHADYTMMWLPLLTREAFTTYLCKAANHLGHSHARVTVFELPSREPEVKEAIPRDTNEGAPRVGAMYEAVGTYLGTAVVLECTAEGRPPPSVNWSLNHEDVASQCEVTSWTPLDNQVDAFLTISNVTVHHLGNYTCWASNTWGHDQHSINLYDVLSAPASIGAVGGKVHHQGTPDAR